MFLRSGREVHRNGISSLKCVYDDPINVKDALSRGDASKYGSLIKNQTWDLVDLPNGMCNVQVGFPH